LGDTEDDDADESTSSSASSTSPTPSEAARGKPLKRTKSKKSDKGKKDVKSTSYQLNSGSDVVGVIFLEISSVTDLPPEKNGKRSSVAIGKLG
jgi:phosphatidylserine decarboxylase